MTVRSLVGVKEMAAILGVPASRLYQETRLGPQAIPHYRVGKYVRFDPDEVSAFFRANGADGNRGPDGVS